MLRFRQHSLSRGWLCWTALALLAWQVAPAAGAEAPRAPLSLVPATAEFLVEIPSPRRLVESFTGLELLAQLGQFPQVRELLSSTNARRGRQLLAYLEKELGARWPELLDRVAGGGVVLATQALGKPDAPALLVVRGTDAALVGKAARVALSLLEQELARQEVKEQATRTTYSGVECVHIGKGFHLAVLGPTVAVSTVEVALHRAIDLAQGKGNKSVADVAEVRDAGRLLPTDSLARVWLNMEPVRKAPGAEQLYTTPRDPGLTVLFGHYIDVLGRTPYLCAGLVREKDGFRLTIRAPRGRDGMGPERALHMPADPKAPASRPLLQPRGVLYSDSFYLDLSRIWEDRVALFGEKNARAIEEADKNTSRVPFLQVQISKLLAESGPYHRIVVVNQPKGGYKRQPRQAVPAFAFITEMRKPDEFAATVEALIRGGVLLASGQVKLKLVEEKVGEHKLVGWRFDEEAPLKQDVNDLRFGFSPCFVRVENQFVFCSTLELGRELIDLLMKEGNARQGSSPSTTRSRFYASGLAELLATTEDQLITQTILDQAVPAEEAKKQVQAFLAFLRQAGDLNLQAVFDAAEFGYDIRVRAK